ncbi:hypothetical protein QQP08_017071 [Theobroma cacao]|nr:hypothetical protein QQP08_017071 [Theobroma cacao]
MSLENKRRGLNASRQTFSSQGCASVKHSTSLVGFQRESKDRLDLVNQKAAIAHTHSKRVTIKPVSISGQDKPIPIHPLSLQIYHFWEPIAGETIFMHIPVSFGSIFSILCVGLVLIKVKHTSFFKVNFVFHSRKTLQKLLKKGRKFD